MKPEKAEVLLVGEPMALFAAEETGSLSEAGTFTRMMSGAEVNVAIGLTRLGHPVRYVTRLGMDPLADYIERRLREEGIGTQITRDPDSFTGIQLKNKVYEGDPETAYFRKGSAASGISGKDVDRVSLESVRILHLTGIFPALSASCLEAAIRLMDRAKEQGIFISFDPNLRPSLWENQDVMIQTLNQIAARADLVLPGTAEGKILTGSDDPKEIAAYYRKLGAEYVILKTGSDGAYGETEYESCHADGFHVEKVVDTVGAGDGFAVGVLSGLLEGLSLSEILVRGNAVGAIQVSVKSDNEGLPDQDSLRQFIRQGGMSR